MFRDECARMRGLAKRGADVVITEHARRRMQERKVSLAEVYKVLSSGKVIASEPDREEPKYDRWKARGRGVDNRTIDVVLVAEEDAFFIEVITVITV